MEWEKNLNILQCRQFAQRSRVRKLQYIAELERNVQALQVSFSINYKAILCIWTFFWEWMYIFEG